ncbi:MAG: HlyD family secretion protein [Myxococcota bacterium]
MIGVASVVALAALAYYVRSRGYEETDDAQIDGTLSSISARVPGTIQAIAVVENQRVKAGDLLAELDPRDLEVSLAQAKALVAQAEAQLRAEDPSVSMTETSNLAALSGASSDLASAQAGLSAARKEVEQLTAQLAQLEATDRNVQLDRERSSRLVHSGAVTQAEFDSRNNAAIASTAAVEALKQALAAARDRVLQREASARAAESRKTEVQSNAPRQVETRKAALLVRQAALDLARAQLEQAELNRSYARITAPSDGIVGKKSVAVGDRVAPGQQLMAITQAEGLWVTANFRETQLARLRPGQHAKVHVDALDSELEGELESIGGATGSRLSVLPPENASGNYVKVVQRIPVRIRLNPGQSGLDRLRPGMSVEPEVSVQ